MTTPDEAAATPLGLAMTDDLLQAIALTDKHIGELIAVGEVIGVLLTLPRRIERPGQEDLVMLTIQQAGQTLATSLTHEASTVVTLLPHDDEDPADEIPAALDPGKVRELADIEDRLRIAEGSVTELKARREALSKELMGTFEILGYDEVVIDGRKVYLREDTYPNYREREDGTKFTAADAVEVLRTIGRGVQVSPETVNYQTMGSILREYRDAEQPVPPELDAVVKLDSKYSIRVGPPRKKRRTR